MSNLQHYSYFGTLIDQVLHQGGNLSKPASIAIDGQVEERTYSVADAANTVIYANALGAFKYAFFESDFNTRIVVTDTAGSSFSLGLRGSGVSGQYGLGMPIGLGTTVNANITINAITLFNESGSTAKVHVAIMK